MAAGLGFKTFTTGEVLTSGDVNGYLMQGVLVFATAAARNSAITSPQEGQFAFTKDTNGLWYYDGAAWVASGATGDIEGVTAGVGISGGGTSGTVTVTNDMATTITAAGDIVVGTGSGTYDNLPIGTTAQVLTADTTVSPYKVKWAAAAGGFTAAGTAVYQQTSQTISNNTDTFITWDVETFDTDGYHSTSSNTDRFTIPAGKAGKYIMSCAVQFENNSTGNRFLSVSKNGATAGSRLAIISMPANGEQSLNMSFVVDAAVADYFGFYVAQTSGGNLFINGNNRNTSGVTASFMYLGA